MGHSTCEAEPGGLLKTSISRDMGSATKAALILNRSVFIHNPGSAQQIRVKPVKYWSSSPYERLLQMGRSASRDCFIICYI